MKISISAVAVLGFMLAPSLVFAFSGIEDLRKLVEINSGTKNTSGVNQIQDWVAAKLKGLGFEVETSDLTQGRLGKLLTATLKGAAPDFVTVILHADTVFEPSSPFQKFSVSPDGKLAFGPGVIDEKGSILVALNGLEGFLSQNPQPKFSIRVVVSPGEEIGSPGLTAKFRELGENSRLVLGFEPSLEDRAIVQSRRGNRWFHVFVTGKEAHSGRDHNKGVNACLELSRELVELSKLTNYAEGTTVSVGHIAGGQDKFNIVCGSAEAKVDTRFTSVEARDRLQGKVDRILKHPHVRSASTGEPALTRYELEDDCPPYSLSTDAKLDLRRYRQAIMKSEGKDPGAEPSGGSADTNYFSRKGLSVLDGLGAVGGKMHTVDEFIEVDSLKTRAKALEEFLGTL